MKIELTQKNCEAHGLTKEQAMLMIAAENIPDPKATLQECIERGLVSKRPLKEGYFVTNKGASLLEEILIRDVKKNRDLSSLAKELKSIYPRGYKVVGDSKYQWTDAPGLIERRLGVFLKIYGNHSDEEIIDATKRYVASFKGDYETMKLLRYFIYREKSYNGISDPSSDLLNMIENKDEETNNSNWLNEII